MRPASVGKPWPSMSCNFKGVTESLPLHQHIILELGNFLGWGRYVFMLKEICILILSLSYFCVSYLRLSISNLHCLSCNILSFIRRLGRVGFCKNFHINLNTGIYFDLIVLARLETNSFES